MNNDFNLHSKMSRMINLVNVLRVNTTLQRAACKLGVSKRTLYRDVIELREMGYNVEVDSFSQYHVTNKCCPFCGK